MKNQVNLKVVHMKGEVLMKIIMKAITKILIIKILSDGMKKKEKNKRLWVE